MVMPSEETQQSAKPKSDAGVTQPFVTQMYRCIAHYETKDTKNRPFKVEVGEAVDVLIKDKAGERNYTTSCVKPSEIHSIMLYSGLYSCLYAILYIL